MFRTQPRPDISVRCLPPGRAGRRSTPSVPMGTGGSR